MPAGSIDAYKAAEQWKDFTNIQAINTEALEDVQGNPANKDTKFFKDGQLLIEKNGKTYTVQGQEVN